jgi:hypothetical protein
MPFPKKKEVINFEEEDDNCGHCPYDYSQELEQIESASKKKLKRVR